MAGTYHELVFHLVWSTKDRVPLITPTVEERLLRYVRAKCEELGYTLHAAGCVEDHLHLLLTLPPTVLIADVPRRLKGASSHYINHLAGMSDLLYWQDGYGVVTLRKREIPVVAEYINRQKEHHRMGRLINEFEHSTA